MPAIPACLAAFADVWRLFLEPPPPHPILVNLTAGLIPSAVLFDLLGRFGRNASLASAGWWAMLLAAFVTPFTALAGWFWLDDMGGAGGRAGDAMLVHKWLGTSLAVLMVALAFWRWRERRRETRPGARVGARPAYLASAAVFVLFLTVQGHLGGMMSFGGGHEEAAGDFPGAEAAPEDSVWKASVPAPVGGGGHSEGGDARAH